jgi:hypothetical protein
MTPWESSFIAVGVLLGEPVDAMMAAVGAPLPPAAAGLAATLRAEPREARARALAGVVSEVALALNASRLA